MNNDVYRPDSFGTDRPIEFRLGRTRECDKSYGGLKTFEAPDEKGAFTKMRSDFTLVSGVDEDFLPENTRLPCYSIIN